MTNTTFSETLLSDPYAEQEKIDPDVIAAYQAMDMLGHDLPELFRAAEPGYPEHFNRDSTIAMMLSGNEKYLKAQIKYAFSNQGTEPNGLTGEEPGKMHHQMPGVTLEGRHGLTTYNASDTTGLTLTAVASLAERGDTELLSIYVHEIDQAIDYIRRHVHNKLFYEDPKHAEAEQFTLRKTDWKDSTLNHPEREEPVYPVVYTQTHFQNAEALLRIGKVLDRQDLVNDGLAMMRAGLDQLWDEDHFVSAIDAEGIIDPPSSDSLYALLHVPPEILPDGYAERIEKYMQQLETNAGYRAGLPVPGVKDVYHLRYVWVHEQALLHAAARKHGLNDAMQITKRVIDFIKPHEGIFPELLDTQNDFAPAGNKLQLWSVAAYLYFKNPDSALL